MKAFIDCETTGLDPDKHQILTLGLAIYDYSNIPVFEREWSIALQPNIQINEKAMEINKIDLKEHIWVAVHQSIVVYELINTLKEYFGNDKVKAYGHNVIFDLNFINKLCERTHNKSPFHYHYQDTMIISTFLKDMGLLKIDNVKLETLMKHFKIKRKQTHTALDDAKMSATVYFELIELIKSEYSKTR